ncbi:MAG: glycosyltransferase [Verrucomicrobiaceae bacterium]|nr:glycosyltransferase [Verrucomicrobiaceae bacterium]
MKIGACLMVRNMRCTIGAAIASLSNVADSIYLLDDNSADDSAKVAIAHATVPIVVDRADDRVCAFARGELEVRNTMIETAFERLQCDVLVLSDADELFSPLTRALITSVMNQNSPYNSVCIPIYHLHQTDTYFHIWQTEFNGVRLIDPHVRIIRRGVKYQALFKDGSHPTIPPTAATFCCPGPYHYHLKYYHLSPFPNYAFDFLPRYFSIEQARPYLMPLDHTLDNSLLQLIQELDWPPSKQDADYYSAYESRRNLQQSAEQVLVHPRDRNPTNES